MRETILKEKKGITLIALIITIIVVLLLAGISISMLDGQDGILNKASQAKKITERKNQEEMEWLAKYEEMLNTNGASMGEDKIVSLFIWSATGARMSNLQNAVDYLGLNTTYAKFTYSDGFTNYKEKSLIQVCERNNIDMYLLDGSKNWYQEANKANIKNLIDVAYTYNTDSSNTKKFKGVSIDIEFYLTDEYKNATSDGKKEIFAQFVSVMKENYQYAKSKGLNFTICIPVFLDSIDEAKLEELIKDSCDYVQVMNYTKASAVTDIEKEIELARKYDKPIESIAEVQAPNEEKSVTDEITFYNDGLDACVNKFKEIGNQYNYSKLGYSYHYYKPLVELLGNVIDLKAKYYEVEMYPYSYGGDSTEILKAYVLGSNGEKIYGIPTTYTDDQGGTGYILKFYNLEYGKEYTITIEDEGYVLEDEEEAILKIDSGDGEDTKEYESFEVRKPNALSLELYAYVKSTNQKINILSGKLISGSEEIEGEIVEIDDDDIGTRKIIYFGPIDYNKEYTIEAVLEDGYTLVEGQTFTFTDTSRYKFYDDIYVNVVQ